MGNIGTLKYVSLMWDDRASGKLRVYRVILEALKYTIGMDIDHSVQSKRESYHLLPYLYPPILSSSSGANK